jgi:hypothetical protein
MSETLFNAALVACLLLTALASEPDRARPLRWAAAAGVAFGCMAWIKAEPLILTPVLLLCFVLGPCGLRGALRPVAVLLLAAALVFSPWVVRNYVHFGRLIVTTRTGPANAWLGHHEGASGGQSIRTAVVQERYLREHPEVSGYRLAWEFARDHPREELALAWKKLVLTYGRDDDAVTLIRGVQPRVQRHVSLDTEMRLRRVANLFWACVCLLALAGLPRLRGTSAQARVLVLGVPAAWLVVHLLFIGGSRFHVPETPSIALLAGAGATGLRGAVRRLRTRDS